MLLRWILVGALVGLAAPSPAVAQDPPPRRSTGVLFRLGLDFGGEELAEVRWSDGHSSTIRAGQLVTFAGGLLYQPTAPWSLEATIGYKLDRKSAFNGSIQFARIPLDVVASYASSGHRLGVGTTFHFAPTLSCDGTVCGGSEISISLDTSIGLLAQYAYGFRRGDRGFEIGVRYTRIQYSSNGVEPFDGSSFGGFLGSWL